MKKKKPDGKAEPYNFWMDDTAPEKQFDHADFMKRLQDVHGIDPAATKGTRRMSMHMDAADWFSYVWDWEIGGKKFTQHTRQMRTGMNKQIWADEG